MPGDPISDARAAVEAEKAAKAAWEEAILVRDDRVREAFDAHPDLGPTALAKAVGLGPSLLRVITREQAQQRRREQGGQ